MKNYSDRSLEIFSSSELFLRTPHVVESLDYEYHEYCEFGMNTESAPPLVLDYLCHRHTHARSIAGEEKMIRSL